jgi:hypothetical protein
MRSPAKACSFALWLRALAESVWKIQPKQPNRCFRCSTMTLSATARQMTPPRAWPCQLFNCLRYPAGLTCRRHAFERSTTAFTDLGVTPQVICGLLAACNTYPGNKGYTGATGSTVQNLTPACRALRACAAAEIDVKQTFSFVCSNRGTHGATW